MNRSFFIITFTFAILLGSRVQGKKHRSKSREEMSLGEVDQSKHKGNMWGSMENG